MVTHAHTRALSTKSPVSFDFLATLTSKSRFKIAKQCDEMGGLSLNFKGLLSLPSCSYCHLLAVKPLQYYYVCLNKYANVLSDKCSHLRR